MNISLLGVTAAMLSALVAACILPQRAERGDDAGDGRAVVLIPRPVPTSRHRPRTWTFLAGLIVDGEPVRSTTTIINHHPVNVPTLRVHAIGSGGGAIASIPFSTVVIWRSNAVVTWRRMPL